MYRACEEVFFFFFFFSFGFLFLAHNEKVIGLKILRSTGRPTMPNDFDWSESFPEFFSQEETTGEELLVMFWKIMHLEPEDVELGSLLLKLYCDELYSDLCQIAEESNDLGESLSCSVNRRVRNGNVSPHLTAFPTFAVPSDK